MPATAVRKTPETRPMHPALRRLVAAGLVEAPANWSPEPLPASSPRGANIQAELEWSRADRD
jgi:hypothetical protein